MTRPRGRSVRVRRLRGVLLRWYLRHRRDLPWRRTRDPYAIWVSEIMLQQTRVETVIPYYARFLDRFPTVESLARAREEDVVAAWSGLGYYRRARHLREAAVVVARDHGGVIPDDPETLRRLPGIGGYTAAAIASVAFGHAAAAVDGNVIRVLARIAGLRGSRVSPRLKREVTRTAEELATGPRPGDWTQALMELGAVICLPRDPRCDACPARGVCVANASGHPDRYPEPPVAKEPRRVDRVMLVAWDRGRLFLVRESAGSPPSWTIPHAETGTDPGRAARALARKLGLGGAIEGPVARFRHRTFAEDSGIEVWRLRPGRDAAGRQRLHTSDRERRPVRDEEGTGRWVSSRAVDGLPTRGPTLKALKKLHR